MHAEKNMHCIATIENVGKTNKGEKETKRKKMDK